MKSVLPHLSVDPKLVFELAAGMEDPDAIAERYRLTAEGWSALKNDENFKKLVDSKRAELQKSGYTFRLKAALAAESLLDDIYLGAKDIDASLTAKLEAFKYLTKLGGLEPKEDKTAQQGPAFSIRIDLSGDNSATIDIQSPKPIIDVEDEEFVLIDDLPTPPAHLLQTLPLDNALNAANV